MHSISNGMVNQMRYLAHDCINLKSGEIHKSDDMINQGAVNQMMTAVVHYSL